jgi:hypothetical protein
VLGFFLGEAEQRPQPGLVAIDVGAGAVHDQGDDVLLDEGEDVAVAVAPDLVEHPLLVVVEAGDAAHPGDAFGQEGLGEVEVAALEAVVHGPGVVDRAFEAGVVAIVVGQHGVLLAGCRLHSQGRDGPQRHCLLALMQ